MSQDKNRLEFPEGFLWGASTSAHQVEGGNDNNWTEWEQQNASKLAADAHAGKDYGNGKGTVPNWELVAEEAKEPQNYLSGSGVEFWERWQDDINSAHSLGMTALRYSIEWSRVEPSEGDIDHDALGQYRRIAEYCLESGIQPFITLHHFTHPEWIDRKKSWENKQVIDRFGQYVETAVDSMPAEGLHWLVINEPEVLAGLGWIYGQWPPNKHNPLKYRAVTNNLAEAHKRSYDIIKQHDETAQVSSAVNNIHFEPSPGPLSIANRGMARIARQVLNHRFHKATMDHQDFIGLNHYMHCVINGGVFKNDREQEPRSDLGWFLNPESMYHVLKDLKRYDKPVIVTENGLADGQDTRRGWFITETLRQMHRAIEEGVDVRGYLHWSLLDNFEWDKGYWPRFGLINVDRTTMERQPRESAHLYAEIIAANGIEK